MAGSVSTTGGPDTFTVTLTKCASTQLRDGLACSLSVVQAYGCSSYSRKCNWFSKIKPKLSLCTLVLFLHKQAAPDNFRPPATVGRFTFGSTIVGQFAQDCDM